MCIVCFILGIIVLVNCFNVFDCSFFIDGIVFFGLFENEIGNFFSVDR